MNRSQFRRADSCKRNKSAYSRYTGSDTETEDDCSRGSPHNSQKLDPSFEQSGESLETDDAFFNGPADGSHVRVVKSSSHSSRYSKPQKMPVQDDALEESADSVEIDNTLLNGQLSGENIRKVNSSVSVNSSKNGRFSSKNEKNRAAFTPKTINDTSRERRNNKHQSLSSNRSTESEYPNEDDQDGDKDWEKEKDSPRGWRGRNRSSNQESSRYIGSSSSSSSGNSWSSVKRDDTTNQDLWSSNTNSSDRDSRQQWNSAAPASTVKREQEPREHEQDPSSSSLSSSSSARDRNDRNDRNDRSEHNTKKGSSHSGTRDRERREGREGREGRSAFSDYVANSNAKGITIPRKSGRYEADDHTTQETDPDSRDDDSDKVSSNLSDEDSPRPDPRSKHKNGWSEPPAVKRRGSNESSAVYEPYDESGTNLNTATRIPFVLVAHSKGIRTDRVQCTIKRERRTIEGKIYPTYELILENPRKLLIVARKMKMNRKANYHLFDMTRGAAGSVFTKKSGNYMGKLRATNNDKVSYVLLNPSCEREEVAGIVFEKVGLLNQITDGSSPRIMRMIVPSVDHHGIPVPHKLGKSKTPGQGSDVSLPELLKLYYGNSFFKPSEVCHLLHTKAPVFENGNYRLNFHGRVCKPSVKNFQMIDHEGDIDDIICQFGKVDDDVFHLDYKAPLNALQAFALALCQFNI